jgi:hypothetical protein
MVAMLAENGHGENGHAVPPTIQALLAARIDELGPDERFVIEPAAVIGHEFWREALVELSPKDLAVSAALQRLIRKELIARAVRASPKRTPSASGTSSSAMRRMRAFLRPAAPSFTSGSRTGSSVRCPSSRRSSATTSNRRTNTKRN